MGDRGTVLRSFFGVDCLEVYENVTKFALSNKKASINKIMRKIVLALIVAFGVAGGYAQNEAGKFSIKPLAGVNRGITGTGF